MNYYLAVCDAVQPSFMTLMVIGVGESRRPSHFSTLRDGNIRSWPLASKPRVLHFANNVHAVDDFAEDDVLVVQERCRDGADEELATVRVRS